MDRQLTTAMADDVERQTHDETPKENKAKKAGALLVLVLVSAAIAACITGLLLHYGDNAHYSVAIDSASALACRTGVSFNLTLVVASRSHGAKACIEPGTYVEVSYRGFQVAASDGAETRRTCARPRNVAALPVVARATMTPVGDMLDSLGAEMGQGTALFDLRLVVPYHGKGGMANSVSECNGSHVGDAAVHCSFLR